MPSAKPTRQIAIVAAGLVVVLIAIILVFRYVTAEHERKLASLPPKERGAVLMQDVGCTDCHQPGSAFRAPILTGLFGKTVKLQDGSQVTADEAYLLRSILEPKAQMVQGYQAIMPSYEGRLSTEDIAALIEAMK